MAPSKQNLFLFFEKDAEKYDYHLKLVHSYMNRFVIEEDSQFEVVGIYVGSEWKPHSVGHTLLDPNLPI